MRDEDAAVTVLRNRDGVPQHAVLDWDAYQALLGPTGHGATTQQKSTDVAARAARRLGGEVAATVPEAVRRHEQAGAHPVRAWREASGWNQAQLAAFAGISRTYLAQIETGDRTGTLEVMAKLARSLGCLIEDLLREEPDAFASRVAGLARMPITLRQRIDATPAALWRTRPADGGFSLVEHVCHLRDIEIEGYQTRVGRMLNEVDPPLFDIDGGRLAAERDYPSQDLEAAFTALAAARREVTTRLAGLAPAERTRAGIMDGSRRVTIEDLVSAMTAHDSEHAQELDALAATLRATHVD